MPSPSEITTKLIAQAAIDAAADLASALTKFWPSKATKFEHERNLTFHFGVQLNRLGFAVLHEVDFLVAHETMKMDTLALIPGQAAVLCEAKILPIGLDGRALALAADASRMDGFPLCGEESVECYGEHVKRRFHVLLASTWDAEGTTLNDNVSGWWKDRGRRAPLARSDRQKWEPLARWLSEAQEVEAVVGRLPQPYEKVQRERRVQRILYAIKEA